MDDLEKTKDRLIQELNRLRARIGEVECLNTNGHRRMEEELRESESRYQELFNGIISGVAVYEAWNDGEDFIIRDFNPAAERIERVKKEDILGKKVTEVFPGIREMTLMETFRRVWKSGMAEKHPVSTYQDNHITSWRDNFVYKLPSGEVVALYEDITERKQAEMALRESEERFRTLFETMEQGVVYHNADGTIISANPAAERILGLTFDQMRGRTSMDPLWRTVREDGSEFSGKDHPSMAALQTGKEVRGAVMGVSNASSGEYTWIEINAIPQFKPGEAAPVQVYTIFEDITGRRRAEKTIRLKDELLHMTGEMVKVGGWEFDVATGKGTWTDEVARIHDLDPSLETSATLGISFYSGESREKLESAIKDAVEQAKPYDLELEMVSARGIAKWVRTIGFPIMDGDKEVKIRGVFQDITERKQAEETLRESESRLRFAFDQSPVGMVIVSLEGRFLQTNEAFRRFIGYENEDLLLLGFADITHPDEVAYDVEQVRRLKIGEIEQYSRDKRYIRKDGTVVWGHVLARLLKDITGRSLNHFALIIDITDRMQAEEQLRRHEIQYSAILTATMDGFTLYCREGRFLDVNGRFCKMYGYSREEILSLSIFNVSVNEDEKEFQAHAENVIEQGFDRYETRHKRKDGGIIEVEVSVNYVPVQDCFIAFYRDLNEKKRLEEQFRQAQKMESVGRLAGGVAHDFNNILTAIIGNAELAIMSLSSSSDTYQDIVEIRKAAERAANLTRQLLAFSRKQVIVPRALNLNGVILDMDKMLRRIIGEHIEYHTLVSPDLRSVSMDPGQVEQVLTNLAVNSRDAMPTGGKLTIETANICLDTEYARTHPEAAPGDYVMLAVSDTGTGMNQTVKDHLFEPFFTTKPRGSGTGLGLSTCYGIVKQNRGSIAVYSEPGHGTTMKVYLPAIPDSAVLSPEPPKSIPGYPGEETILVVEDEPVVRAMVVRILEEQGYVVLTAGDGAEAMEVASLHSGAIHALITDIIMPRMGGKELAVKITALRPALKVLYMSGYTDNTIGRHGILDPGVEFIQKPFSPLALAKKVREMLDG